MHENDASILRPISYAVGILCSVFGLFSRITSTIPKPKASVAVNGINF
jgi:hypothetical protein